MLYIFDEARILLGAPPGVESLRWESRILTSGDEELAMQTRFKKWNKTHTLKTRPHQFARLLAKIAYSFAAAEFGIDAFTPLVREIILGTSEDFAHAVGGSLEIAPAIPNSPHTLDLSVVFVELGRALIRVDIRLFPSAGTPSYHVVPGLIDFQNQKHIRAFQQHRASGKMVERSAIMSALAPRFPDSNRSVLAAKAPVREE